VFNVLIIAFIQFCRNVYTFLQEGLYISAGRSIHFCRKVYTVMQEGLYGSAGRFIQFCRKVYAPVS
jgi:hypothetical protein